MPNQENSSLCVCLDLKIKKIIIIRNELNDTKTYPDI